MDASDGGGADRWVRVLTLMGAAGVVCGVLLAVGLGRSDGTATVLEGQDAGVSPAPAGPAAPTETIPAPPATVATALPVTDAPDAPPSNDGPAPAPVAPSPAVSYTFPVQPASAASYGRDHHDYPATDIFAECGTALVAPAAGRVDETATVDRWDPAIDDPDTRGGLAVAIVDDAGVRHYMSHLATIDPAVAVDARVDSGQPIGTVGRTGNAAPTPCHVHYGLSPARGPGDTLVRRGVIWPWPYLDSWRAGSTSHSPGPEIAAWSAANPPS